MKVKKLSATRSDLEKLYKKYNHRKFVHPDPLEFLFDYPELEDREIVGLIASSLAYGRVRQILKSVSSVLTMMDSPREYLELNDQNRFKKDFKGFKHRFTTDAELVSLLLGIKKIIARDGSLGETFRKHYSPSQKTILPALDDWIGDLWEASDRGCPSLLPQICRGSACKRHHLLMRWMVRTDAVDPGGWDFVPPSKLIVPIDTHMHRISLEMGLTTRKSANQKTALEITRAFAKISPEDPVKYDFCLTRLGIRKDE